MPGAASTTRKSGFDGLLEECWGAYVAFELDEIDRVVRVLRDPTGRVPCWMAPAKSGTLIFSDLEDALPLLRQPPTVNWSYLAFHAYNRCFHGRETGYNEITEILPGDVAELDDSSVTVERAWRPERLIDRQFSTLDEACSNARTAASASVACWARQFRSVTLDLSGGLDSAIVLGLLRQEAQHLPVIGINWVIEHSEGDERKWARDAADMHQIELVEEDVSARIEREAPAFQHRLLRPAVRTLPLGYDQVGMDVAARFSTDGFFTGTGGDHIFHDGASSALAFDYRQEKGWRGLLPFCHQLAQLTGTTIWRTLASARGSGVDVYRDNTTAMCQPSPLLRDNFTEAGSAIRYLHPTITEAIPSLTPERATMLLNMLELQTHYWRYGRADVSEEVHPLFAQPVMEASLRTPMHWFVAGEQRRGLARRAFRDLLPQSIATRRSKSSNSSHWIKVLEYHLPRLRTMLMEGELSSRGIIQISGIKDLLTPLGLIESKHFSTIMNIISVEQWIREA